MEKSKTTKPEIANTVVDSAMVIGEKVTNILNIIATLEGAPTLSKPPSAPGSGILISTMLIDDEGVEVMSLRELMFKCTTLENEVELM